MKCFIMLFLGMIFIIVMFKVSYSKESFTTSNIDVEKLMSDGYLIIPNIVSHKDCDDILEIISDVEKKKNKCGNIHSSVNRKDMMLPVKRVKKYIKNIYNSTKHIWDNVTPNPIICECSSLVSYPGAYPQIWHTDTTYRKTDGNLVSIGVSLKNVTKEMGPLNVYKKSVQMYNKKLEKLILKHKIDLSNDMPSDVSDINEVQSGIYTQVISELCKKMGYEKKECITRKGDIVIWLSSVVHRGSANISSTNRPIFYFSLLSSKGTPPRGSTYSLLNKRLNVSSL